MAVSPIRGASISRDYDVRATASSSRSTAAITAGSSSVDPPVHYWSSSTMRPVRLIAASLRAIRGARLRTSSAYVVISTRTAARWPFYSDKHTVFRINSASARPNCAMPAPGAAHGTTDWSEGSESTRPSSWDRATLISVPLLLRECCFQARREGLPRDVAEVDDGRRAMAFPQTAPQLPSASVMP